MIYNGIDLDEYHKVETTAALERFGIDLNEALRAFRRPDYPTEGDHSSGARDQIHDARVFRWCSAPARPTRRRSGGKWKRRWPRPAQKRAASSGFERWWISRACIELYSHAAVFCCPSIYEPFGIINLEAMACEDRGGGERRRRNQGSGGRWRDRISGSARADGGKSLRGEELRTVLRAISPAGSTN